MVCTTSCIQFNSYIFDIDTGKIVGRIEDVVTSGVQRQVCWVVGNRLYLMAALEAKLYCWEISSKSKGMMTIPIILIGTGLLIPALFLYVKRKKKKTRCISIKKELYLTSIA